MMCFWWYLLSWFSRVVSYSYNMLETISFLILIGWVRVLARIFWWSEGVVTIVDGILALWALRNLSKLWAPFLPSSQKKVQVMMKLADIQPWDVLYELWSGDGRILRASLLYHPKKIVGYELSRILIVYSRVLNYIRKEQIQYKRVDLFTQDFSDADVIFCFLLPVAVKRVEEQIWPTLKPWTKLLTNIFTFE